jgi:hypothetical protein
MRRTLIRTEKEGRKREGLQRLGERKTAAGEERQEI